MVGPEGCSSFSVIRWLVPSIYCLPQNISGMPGIQKYLIFSDPENIPILYPWFKKTLHKMDKLPLKLVERRDVHQKNIHNIFISKNQVIFSDPSLPPTCKR